MSTTLDEISFHRKHLNSNFDYGRKLARNQKLKCPSKIVAHKPPLPKKKRSQKSILMPTKKNEIFEKMLKKLKML